MVHSHVKFERGTVLKKTPRQRSNYITIFRSCVHSPGSMRTGQWVTDNNRTFETKRAYTEASFNCVYDISGRTYNKSATYSISTTAASNGLHGFRTACGVEEEATPTACLQGSLIELLARGLIASDKRIHCWRTWTTMKYFSGSMPAYELSTVMEGTGDGANDEPSVKTK